MMRFEIYRSEKSGEWHWRLRAGNNEIIASGEGYENLADCQRAVGMIQATSALTMVVQEPS